MDVMGRSVDETAFDVIFRYIIFFYFEIKVGLDQLFVLAVDNGDSNGNGDDSGDDSGDGNGDDNDYDACKELIQAEHFLFYITTFSST